MLLSVHHSSGTPWCKCCLYPYFMDGGLPARESECHCQKHTGCHRTRRRLSWQKDPGLLNTSPSSTRKMKRQDSRRFISNPSPLISSKQWNRDETEMCRPPSALRWNGHPCPVKPTPALSPCAVTWGVLTIRFNV